MYVQSKEAWLLWLVYKINIKDLTFGVGADADEVAFMNPVLFENSSHESERLVYKFCTKHI
jgi:hypothetical protein